jgi:hypothetical protein
MPQTRLSHANKLSHHFLDYWANRTSVHGFNYDSYLRTQQTPQSWRAVMKEISHTQSGIFNPRSLFAFALCSVGALLAVFSFAATPAVQMPSPTQGNWTQLGSYTPPVVRQNPVMVNDIATGQVLLFGGQTPTQVNNGTGLVNDTWTFNGQRWIQLYPPASPSPRGYAAAAYDAARHLVVVFGGLTTTGEVSETWIWDGTTWTQQQPAHAPSARFAAAMAYDPATQRVVLFGGVNVGPGGVQIPLADTWTWDGSDWSQQSPILSPPARFLFGFADGGATSAPVLFGGNPGEGNLPLDDTWTWNGPSNSWTLQPATSSPSARFGASMAYDPQLSKTVLFGGSTPNAGCSGSGCGVGNQVVGDTWTWNGTQWAQISVPGVAPDGRVYVGMAFDPVHSGTTLFGGVTNNGWQNDTWRFDGSTWTREDLTAPDELASAMLAREPGSLGTAVLFSGQGEYGADSTQTWRWTGSQWALLSPAHSPLSRQWGTLTFDPARNSTILFGGLVDTYGQPGTRQEGDANDTWSWDGTDWTQLNPVTSPPARYYAAAAFDAARGQVVVFGGFSLASGILNDTWTWDGRNWTQQHPTNSPPARFTAGMAYDAATQQVVLFGGTVSNQQYFSDTWTWDGSGWTQQQPNNVPPARAYTSMAYDPTSSSVILFGGCTTCFGTPTDSDTWSWNGQDWTELQPGNVPPGRGAEAMVDGNALSPLLMFGGQQQGNGSFDSGTTKLNDLWAFGPPLTPTGVVSRKTHGSVGTFDVDLPLTGNPGIECRSGGANGDYTMIFTFANPLTSVGGASVTSGTGSVASKSIDSTDAHNYIVNLTGVTNAQYITVSLANVTDSAGDFSSAVSVQMGVLLGDVNASGRVDAADVSLVRQQTLQPVTSSNFREDINASGRIDAADVSIARQQTLTSLP